MKEINNIQDLQKELEGFDKLQSLKGKETFRVPDSYFEHLENEIMSKIAKEPVPAQKFYLSTKQLFFYLASASIVAIFIFIALRSGNQNAKQPSIANEPIEQINSNNPTANIKTKTKQNTTHHINKSKQDSTIHIGKMKIIDESAIALKEKSSPQNIKFTTKGAQQQQSMEKIDESKPIIANNTTGDVHISNVNRNGGMNYSDINSHTSINDYSPALARKAVQKHLNLGKERCSNKAVLLNAQIEGFGKLKYQWSTGDTTETITATKSGIYWVNVYDIKEQLLGADTVKVNIVPKPKPNLPKNKTICNYETILISSNCNNPHYDYKWSISDVKTPEIYLSDLDPGIYHIILSVTSCADTSISEMILTVDDCHIKIPNVITPNNDGKNDRFAISGLNYYPGSQLQIFDRNGNIVYESIDYMNDWKADQTPSGTYFYRLLLNDKNKTEKNGILTIIR